MIGNTEMMNRLILGIQRVLIAGEYIQVSNHVIDFKVDILVRGKDYGARYTLDDPSGMDQEYIDFVVGWFETELRQQRAAHARK